jgi:hypothetical protein
MTDLLARSILLAIPTAALLGASCTASGSGQRSASPKAPNATATAEGTRMEVVSVQRPWSAPPPPAPSPGHHFVRAVVRFTSVSQPQDIFPDSLALVTSQPKGFGQPFGTGAGLSIEPIPPDCQGEAVSHLVAGQSVIVQRCWEIPDPASQPLTLAWTSNHGSWVTVAIPSTSPA